MIAHAKKILPALLAASVLTACAQNPATGGYNFVVDTEEDELNMGHIPVQRAIKEMGLYKEKPEFYDYYKDLAAEIVGVSERPDIPFDFIMLNDPTFNAWAIPGYVNMYRGIVPFFNSEAEMMSVLAHEVGHVTARHSVRKKANGTVANIALIAVAGYLGSRSNNDGIAAAGIAGASLLATLSLSKYSRSFEDEADMLALRYMEKLGYDSRESYNMFRMMRNYKELADKEYAYFNEGEKRERSALYSVFDSHPDSEHRMSQVVKRIGAPDLSKPSATQEKFYDMMDGIAWGPDFRKYGAISDDAVYLPRSKFYWQLPEGFYFKHGENGWSGYNQASDTEILMGIDSVDRLADAEEVLRGEFTGVYKVESLDVNGIEVYTGLQRQIEKGAFGTVKEERIRRIFVMKATADEDKETTRAFFIAFQPRKGADFKGQENSYFESIRTLRQLTRKQADQLSPVRVKIHTVQKGETIESLSNKMAVAALKEDWFRTLNNLDDEAPALKVGQKVKLLHDPNQTLDFIKKARMN